MLPNKATCFSSWLYTYAWGIGARRLVRTERRSDYPSPTVCELDGPYTRPVMRTSVPGPKTQQILQRMGEITESRVALSCIDFEKSQGNYVVDADGNIMLDLFCQIASLPLGYNHPAIVEAATKKENLVYLINRPATPFQPPMGIVEMLQTSLLKCAPPGMSQVTTMGCGSCANENAIKAAMIRYQDKRRGFQLPDENSVEFKTALWNKASGIKLCISLQSSWSINYPNHVIWGKGGHAPGCPDLCVLSFSGGLHGRTIGVLSTTHSKPIHKLDIPAFDWPIAPFPQLKYPLEDHVTENKAEEKRCLQKVEELIEEFNSKGRHVVALIVEPIQSEGGDNHASPHFFKQLRRICKEKDVSMIVDEVQTGVGPTGTMWAHEAWDLDDPPEYVTFGKKMQLGGYYQLSGHGPRHAMRINNTWMGDPARMMMLHTIVKEIVSNNWVDNVRVTGDVLLAGMKQLQELYPQLIHSVRGVGTFCAFNGRTVDIRNNLLSELKNNGVQVKGCGDDGICLRPSLVFQCLHAEIFLDVLESVLRKHK